MKTSTSDRIPPPAPQPAPALDPDAVRVSYGTVDVLPRRRIEAASAPGCCFPPDLGTASRYFVFLLVQGFEALIVGAVLLVGLVFCILLVPLCGLGIWLFRLLFRLGVVDFCAKCDAAMVNYVATDREQIQIDTSRTVLPLLPAEGLPSERLVSGLRTVSAESAMVLVYLTVIKLVLATAGLCIAAYVLTLPVVLVHALLSHERVLLSSSFTSWEAFCAYTALVLVFLIAIVSMELVVSMCTAATRFFCCERVYAVPLPRALSTTTTTTTRPNNVVVIRLPPSASGVYTLASTTFSTAAPSHCPASS